MKLSLPAKILIFTGLLLLSFAGYLIFQRYDTSKLEFAEIPTKTYVNSTRFPRLLVIDNFDIRLPIHPAKIIDNQWEGTTKGVSYLTSSPIPGEKGNSIIYGHNWTNLLGSLPKIEPGDEIEIVYDNDTTETFIVSSTSIVDPSQIGILDNTDDNRITIYTCTGFLDSKRFVATALLKN